MKMTRYWMTGCMAIMLLAAARWPTPDEQDEVGDTRGGWISLISRHSVDDTVRQIERAAKARQMAVVAQTSAPLPQAAGVDQVMAQADDARVLVLGDTDGHTPAVQSDLQTIPDLPMKVLVHQRADGLTEVLFSDPQGLRQDALAPSDWRQRLLALPKVLKAALA